MEQIFTLEDGKRVLVSVTNYVDVPPPPPEPTGVNFVRVGPGQTADYPANTGIAKQILEYSADFTGEGDGNRDIPYIIGGDELKFWFDPNAIQEEFRELEFALRVHSQGSPCTSIKKEFCIFEELPEKLPFSITINEIVDATRKGYIPNMYFYINCCDKDKAFITTGRVFFKFNKVFDKPV